MKAPHSTLSLPLYQALSRLGRNLEERAGIEEELDRLLPMLDDIPAGGVAKAEREIRGAARLHERRVPEAGILDRLFASNSKLTHLDQLERVPGLRWLFIFHPDGRVREAALAKISGAVPSAFMFSVIGWRLNDWATPVRKAAVECARRTFPVTAAQVVGEAALVLLARKDSWGRWESERSLLDETFARPDVAERLADILRNMRTGPAATILRRAIRNDGLDPHLMQLASQALQPVVRAVALQSLIDGYAVWPDRFEWQWVDKTMGARRRVTAFERRPLAENAARNPLIMMGLADPSAGVRKVALDGLIRYRADLPQARQIARTLLSDRAPSVRERADFLTRVTAEEI